MRTSVTNNTVRVVVWYGASAAYEKDDQFNEEKGDVSLNCFRELAIVPVGIYNGIQMQANEGAYNDHSTKVEEDGQFNEEKGDVSLNCFRELAIIQSQLYPLS